MAAVLAFNSRYHKEAAEQVPSLRENTKEAIEMNREAAEALGILDSYNAACSTLNV